jgi:hypothetical protein
LNLFLPDSLTKQKKTKLIIITILAALFAGEAFYVQSGAFFSDPLIAIKHTTLRRLFIIDVLISLLIIMAPRLLAFLAVVIQFCEHLYSIIYC